jgi:hypothetical protein
MGALAGAGQGAAGDVCEARRNGDAVDEHHVVVVEGGGVRRAVLKTVGRDEVVVVADEEKPIIRCAGIEGGDEREGLPLFGQGVDVVHGAVV